jgi:Kef-type K+ transport system membrane component KefB
MPDQHLAARHSSGAVRLTAGYLILLGAAVGVFFLIRSFGETLETAQALRQTVPIAAPITQHFGTFFHVLLALTAILVVGRGLGGLLRLIGQPPVIGEVVAGILLGPSLLGRIAPEAMDFLFPIAAAPYLGVISQLGVVLYMFLIGLELNTERLRTHAHATVAISHASIVVPFVLGAALALWLYPALADRAVSFTSFALFMGVALAITAFPVLARILADRQLDKTPLGVVALSCAAIDDVTAWCLLALVVGVHQAQVDGAILVVALAVLYLAFMFVIARPVAARVFAPFRDEAQVSSSVVAGVLAAVLTSALITEAIGIHAIFGAFLLGAVIPHDSAVVRVFHRKLHDVVTILLLPAFFAYTGLRTQIGLVEGLVPWLMCGTIIVVGTVGKFGGTLAAARFTGLTWRDSAALGALMNTRGLMALIVLNLGVDLGVISPTLFAMMVLMALVTTLATAPALQWLRPRTNS